MPATLSEADCRAIDRSDMAAKIEGLPGQIRAQRAQLDRDPWPRDLARPSLLAYGGMGGSAIAADLVFGWAADRLTFPTLVVRDERWPRAVSPGALAVLSSYSGRTEETLALFREARARGVACVGLTTGGPLGEGLSAAGCPWKGLPAGLPPRAAIGYSVVSLARLLEALGDPGEGEPAWEEALAVLDRGNARFAPAIPEPDNPAKGLARDLVGRAVCLYGAAGWPQAVARRVKGQINENAKAPAFELSLPEMNHNEIVGFEALPDLHPRLAAAFVLDAANGPRFATRIAVTRRLLEDEGIGCVDLVPRGSSALARMLSLVQLGDWLSYYLGILAGVDPTPITKIDRLKHALEAGA
jgi:glucose/mannose-6-phosphate isomerase